MIKANFVTFLLAALFAAAVSAEGNLAIRAKRLTPLQLDAVQGFSVKSYDLVTGQYYRWRIESDGRDEYKLLAPELMRNAWVDQVVIEDKEVKPLGGIYALEFDDEGIIDVYFIVVRPGTYEFFVQGYRNQGMLGQFAVK